MFYRVALVLILALAACKDSSSIAADEAQEWLSKNPELTKDWAIGCGNDGTCILTHQDGAALVLSCNSSARGCEGHKHGCALVVRGCSALRPCRTYTVDPNDM